jgi:ketosteroid isomerase-like protein
VNLAASSILNFGVFMRKYFAMQAVFLLIASLIAVAAGPRAERDIKQQAALIEAEHSWTDTYKTHDLKVMQQLAGDDFVFTDEQGAFMDKAAYFKSLDDVKVDGYTMTDLQAFIYGNTGIVTGLWTGKYTVGGKDASGSSRFTDTFVRREGRWYIVASHDSHATP